MTYKIPLCCTKEEFELWDSVEVKSDKRRNKLRLFCGDCSEDYMKRSMKCKTCIRKKSVFRSKSNEREQKDFNSKKAAASILHEKLICKENSR